MSESRPNTRPAHRGATAIILLVAGALPLVAGTLLPLVAVTPTLAAAEDDTSNMGTVFLVLLRKGPSWSAEKTPESKTLMEGHLANIKAMWEAKKLAVAGPIGDKGDLRGIYIFKVATIEEAQALTDTDPMIKAGRLVAEIHPWWVDKRALPAAGDWCQPADPK